MIRRFNLAAEELTAQQLAEAIRQAIEAGDFLKHTKHGGGQAIVYIPGLEADRLRHLYHDLIGCVASAYPGESRHDTAKRYIREAESRMSTPSTNGIFP